MRQSRIAYPNLRAEMGRSQISIQTIAKSIGMNRDTLSRKLSKKSPLALGEAFAIASVFPSNNDVQYLFYDDDPLLSESKEATCNWSGEKKRPAP